MEIIPFRSMGELVLGETREVCRSKIQSPFQTFLKCSDSKTETDAFDNVGLHLYYDESYCLEFIEAFKPTDITFRGVRFLGRWKPCVIRDMKRLGFSPVGDLHFLEAGIALTVEWRWPIEAVAVYRNGYYRGNMETVLRGI